MVADVIQQFVLQLEGPYKWYALFFIMVLITGLVTRFVFKTLKWFLLVIAFGLIIFYLWSQLVGEIGNLNSTKSEAARSLQTKILGR